LGILVNRRLAAAGKAAQGERIPCPILSSPLFQKREEGEEKATMREARLTTRGTKKVGGKKMTAARFRHKSPDLGLPWVAFSECNGMIRSSSRPLFSTDKGEESPGGKTMAQRWRAGSTYNRQRVGGVE